MEFFPGLVFCVSSKQSWTLGKLIERANRLLGWNAIFASNAFLNFLRIKRLRLLHYGISRDLLVIVITLVI